MDFFPRGDRKKEEKKEFWCPNRFGEHGRNRHSCGTVLKQSSWVSWPGVGEGRGGAHWYPLGYEMMEFC